MRKIFFSSIVIMGVMFVSWVVLVLFFDHMPKPTLHVQPVDVDSF